MAAAAESSAAEQPPGQRLRGPEGAAGTELCLVEGPKLLEEALRARPRDRARSRPRRASERTPAGPAPCSRDLRGARRAGAAGSTTSSWSRSPRSRRARASWPWPSGPRFAEDAALPRHAAAGGRGRDPEPRQPGRPPAHRRGRRGHRRLLTEGTRRPASPGRRCAARWAAPSACPTCAGSRSRRRSPSSRRAASRDRRRLRDGARSATTRPTWRGRSRSSSATRARACPHDVLRAADQRVAIPMRGPRREPERRGRRRHPALRSRAPDGAAADDPAARRRRVAARSSPKREPGATRPQRPDAPLADRMRPRTLDEILGQDEALGPASRCAAPSRPTRSAR